MRASIVLAALLSALPAITNAHSHGGRREFKNYIDVVPEYLAADSPEMTILRKRDVTAEDPIAAAEEHIKIISEGSEFKKTDSYTSPDTGITHVHFVQTVNGLEVDNARANVNVSILGDIG